MVPKLATLKIQSAEIEPFWATPEILFFLRMRFSNFFLNYMVWKYQNEIAPIFYYGISTKTNEKDIKIPKLQPPDWKSPYWMTLYNNVPDFMSDPGLTSDMHRSIRKKITPGYFSLLCSVSSISTTNVQQLVISLRSGDFRYLQWVTEDVKNVLDQR